MHVDDEDDGGGSTDTPDDSDSEVDDDIGELLEPHLLLNNPRTVEVEAPCIRAHPKSAERYCSPSSDGEGRSRLLSLLGCLANLHPQVWQARSVTVTLNVTERVGASSYTAVHILTHLKHEKRNISVWIPMELLLPEIGFMAQR